MKTKSYYAVGGYLEIGSIDSNAGFLQRKEFTNAQVNDVLFKRERIYLFESKEKAIKFSLEQSYYRNLNQRQFGGNKEYERLVFHIDIPEDIELSLHVSQTCIAGSGLSENLKNQIKINESLLRDYITFETTKKHIDVVRQGFKFFESKAGKALFFFTLPLVIPPIIYAISRFKKMYDEKLDIIAFLQKNEMDNPLGFYKEEKSLYNKGKSSSNEDMLQLFTKEISENTMDKNEEYNEIDEKDFPLDFESFSQKNGHFIDAERAYIYYIMNHKGQKFIDILLENNVDRSEYKFIDRQIYLECALKRKLIIERKNFSRADIVDFFKEEGKRHYRNPPSKEEVEALTDSLNGIDIMKIKEKEVQMSPQKPVTDAEPSNRMTL